MAEKPKYRMGTGEKVFLWGFGVFAVIVGLVAVPALLHQRERARANAGVASTDNGEKFANFVVDEIAKMDGRSTVLGAQTLYHNKYHAYVQVQTRHKYILALVWTDDNGVPKDWMIEHSGSEPFPYDHPMLIGRWEDIQKGDAKRDAKPSPAASGSASPSSEPMQGATPTVLWDGPREGLVAFKLHEFPGEMARFGSEMARQNDGEIRIMSVSKGAFEGKGIENTLLAFRSRAMEDIGDKPPVLALQTKKSGLKFMVLGEEFLPEICFVKTIMGEDGLQKILMADYDQGSGGLSGSLSLIVVRDDQMTIVASQFGKFTARRTQTILPNVTLAGEQLTVGYYQEKGPNQWEKLIKPPPDSAF